MGFFKKLFRRKNQENVAPKNGGGSRKERRAAARKRKASTKRDESPTQPSEHVAETFVAPSTNRGNAKPRGPDVSEGTQRPVLSPRNELSFKKHQAVNTGPIDLDEDEEKKEEIVVQATSSKESSASPPAAAVEHTMEDFASATRTSPKSPSPVAAAVSSKPVFAMPDEPTRFSAGKMGNADDESDGGESSSFNLSTDAEDNEYETMRRRLGVTPPTDVLSVSGNTLLTNYTTDGETSVFPGLASEDENTTTTNSISKEAAQQSILTLNPATGASLVPEPAFFDKQAAAAKPAAAYGAAAAKEQAPPAFEQRFSESPPAAAVVKEATATTIHSYKSSHSPKDEQQRKGLKTLALPKKDSPERSSRRGKQPYSNANFMDAVYGGGNNNQQQRRNFTSPKTEEPKFDPFAETAAQPFDKAASPPFVTFDDDKKGDEFADFADFSKFPSDFAKAEKPKPVQRSSSGQRKPPEAIHNETSLSELLAQAKSKSRGPVKKSSVSSAPAITAAYLRQHHNLRDSTSVTDIIESLEAANVSRAAPRNAASSSRSLGGSRHTRSASDHSSVRSSRERLRRRRERQKDGEHHSSESDEDEEDNENWLFDEVTGALGPRGIAADLESLSGRSGRSNSSRGAKSHKSHRSSQRRRRRTRNGNSDNSVDSRGSRHSRDSRRSRNSRYSHRSTRSYISQMSEQSRSVANDLLRLEMQLAMVGSGGGGGPEPQSVRSSRRRSTTARRSRITVTAPPGKLGIILANKADSKGTVVSGVRTSSALADRITPGDRIVAIDGEDVSLMTVSEITTIMARKSDFDRTLTVLTTPRHTETASPRSDANYRTYRN